MPLALSRQYRHGDRGVAARVWAAIDNFVWTRASYLLPRGAALPGDAAAATAMAMAKAAADAAAAAAAAAGGGGSSTM